MLYINIDLNTNKECDEYNKDVNDLKILLKNFVELGKNLYKYYENMINEPVYSKLYFTFKDILYENNVNGIIETIQIGGSLKQKRVKRIKKY